MLLDENNVYQIWVPSDVMLLDVEAVTKTLLAQVKIENNKYNEHIDTFEDLSIIGKNSFSVTVRSSSGNYEKAYTVNINRLDLSLRTVEVAPHGSPSYIDAQYDSNLDAYVIRLDPKNANAIVNAVATNSDNYVRIGHLWKPSEPVKTESMSQEQYDQLYAQYVKDLAAFNKNAASYGLNADVKWDGQTEDNDGWVQATNTSYDVPLADTDGGFTMVKLQVGAANQKGDTLAERIGAVKTYNLLIGRKYMNVDNDIDIYIDNKKLTEYETEEDGTIVFRYGIRKDAPSSVLFNTYEYAPSPYDPKVTVAFPLDEINKDFNPLPRPMPVKVNDADEPDSEIQLISVPEAGEEYTKRYKVIIYRLSQDTSLEHDPSLEVNARTTVNETGRTSSSTSL